MLSSIGTNKAKTFSRGFVYCWFGCVCLFLSSNVLADSHQAADASSQDTSSQLASLSSAFSACTIDATKIEPIVDSYLSNTSVDAKPENILVDLRQCFNQVFTWSYSQTDTRDRSDQLLTSTFAVLSQFKLTTELRVKLEKLDRLSALAMDFRLAGMQEIAVQLQQRVVDELKLGGQQTHQNNKDALSSAIAWQISMDRLALFLLEADQWGDAERVLVQIDRSELALDSPSAIQAEHHDIKGLLAGKLGHWNIAVEEHASALRLIKAAQKGDLLAPEESALEELALEQSATVTPSLKTPSFKHKESEYRNNYGVAQQYISEFSSAAEMLNQAYLQRLEQYPDQHPVIAESLYNLAGLNREVDQPAQARQTTNDLALVIADSGDTEQATILLGQSCESIRMQAGESSLAYSTCLHNQAYLESTEGRYGKALKLERRSLQIRQALLPELHPAIASSLNNLGMLMGAIGQYQSQYDHLFSAYQIRVALFGDSHALTASSVHNLGFAQVALGNLEQAREQLISSLTYRLELFAPSHKDIALNQANLSFVLLLLGDVTRAQQFANSAMSTYAASGEESSIRMAHLHNVNGQIARAMGNNEDAEAEYLSALALMPTDRYPTLRSHVEFHLAQSLDERNLRIEAIGILKRTVSRLLSVRDDLDSDLQLSYVSSNQQLFRQLADWLLAEDRIAEAERVLDLLDQYNNDLMLQVRGENELLPVSNEEADDLAFLDSLVAQLQDMVSAQQDISDTISQLWIKARTIERKKKPQSDVDCRVVDSVETLDQPVKQEANGDSGPTARLRYLVSRTSVRLLVKTSNTTRVCTLPTDTETLAEEIAEFRDAVLQSQSNWTRTARRLSNTLYKKLFAPVDPLLTESNITKLVVDLDSVLSFLPIGALHDGSNFLAQRYAISQTTERLGVKSANEINANMVGFGLSQPHQVLQGAALPWVRIELEDIVIENDNDQGAIVGEVFLDNAFTPVAYENAVRKDIPIVHVTGHFELDHDDLSSSFFHAGNGGYLFFDQLINPTGDDVRSLEHVDLLALPSCQTALQPGDIRSSVAMLGTTERGSEVESLAAGAMRAGAKAVLASLWDVSDASTAALTSRIYEHMASGASVAVAMQAAQNEFISGDVSCQTQLEKAFANYAGDPVLSSTFDTTVDPAQYCRASWSSPYHWAGLVLFGGENL